MKTSSGTIQIKPTEQYFRIVQSIMLYIVDVTFEPVNENVRCDHSNEGY